MYNKDSKIDLTATPIHNYSIRVSHTWPDLTWLELFWNKVNSIWNLTKFKAGGCEQWLSQSQGYEDKLQTYFHFEGVCCPKSWRECTAITSLTSEGHPSCNAACLFRRDDGAALDANRFSLQLQHEGAKNLQHALIELVLIYSPRGIFIYHFERLVDYIVHLHRHDIPRMPKHKIRWNAY